MTELITNPAFWAAIAALLGAGGVEIAPGSLATKILEALAIIGSIVAILFAVKDAKEDEK